MKPDERQLLIACSQRITRPGVYNQTFARDVAKELGIHPKRACYLFEKWACKGWYEYGVSCDLGWMLPDGMGAAQAEIDKAATS